MIRLSGTDFIELETSAAGNITYDASYNDIAAADDTALDSSGIITTATTTSIVGATATLIRQVNWLNIVNSDTAPNTVKVKKDIGGTEHWLHRTTLQPGERLQYTSNRGFVCFDSAGDEKVATREKRNNVGRSINLFKVGTALEAAGVWYSFGKDSGFPGAWAPGTPGVAGRATDSTLAADNGCIPLFTPVNSLYIDQFDIHSSVIETAALWDILWVNSGLVVTTLTAQTVNSVTFAARDFNDSTNGEGVMVGILVTAATTNAGAITTIVMSYTNSDGTAGRTATMASYPATAVIGTVVWFQLAAGDKGVRSIQTVTWPTSLVAGSVSLIAARQIVQQSNLIANTGTMKQNETMVLGRRILRPATLIPMAIAPATTAITMYADIGLTDR